MPTEAAFWDKIADKYAATPIADEDAYQRKLRETRSLFTKEMRLLEFGCGTGGTALQHAPYVSHIDAIDISPRMIEIAEEKRAAGIVANVHFQAWDIESFEAAGPGYDMVLGLSILHLLEDRRAIMAKVYDMLPPGGVFVSSTACLGDFMPWFPLLVPFGRLIGKLPLVRCFRQETLETELRRAGFVLDMVWRPAKKQAVFIIARKPE